MNVNFQTPHRAIKSKQSSERNRNREKSVIHLLTRTSHMTCRKTVILLRDTVCPKYDKIAIYHDVDKTHVANRQPAISVITAFSAQFAKTTIAIKLLAM